MLQTSFKASSTRVLHAGPEIDQPLFSVIINNYNYEAYVGRALESIDAQVFRSFEIIVVDDGSTDKSREIVCAHPTATLIGTERLGQARACLEAVRHAGGSYIYILDADDEADAHLLQNVAAELKPGVSKVQFQMTPVDAAGRQIAPVFPRYPDSYDSAAMMADVRSTGIYITPQTSGNVFARTLFDDVDDIDYERAIDGVLLLLSPFAGSVRSIPKPLALYRLHGRNESRLGNAEQFAEERRRFVHRLQHLSRILADRGTALHLRTEPDRMLFALDRLLMERVARREPLDKKALALFLRALIRERSPASTAKLVTWLVVSVVGPEYVRRLLLEARGNAWSPLHNPRTLLRAMMTRDEQS